MQVFQKGRFTVSKSEAKDDCKVKRKSRFNVGYEETGGMEYPNAIVSRKDRFILQYPTCAGHSTNESIIGSQVIGFTPKKASARSHDNLALHIRVSTDDTEREPDKLFIEETAVHKPTAPKSSRFSLVHSQPVDARQLARNGAIQRSSFSLGPSCTTSFKTIELDEQSLKLFDSCAYLDVGLEALQLKQKKLVSSSGLSTMNYLFAVQAKIKLASRCSSESEKWDVPPTSGASLRSSLLKTSLY